MPRSEEELSFTEYLSQFISKNAVYIIIIVGFIVFFFSLFNGFVADDLPQIVFNPKAQSVSNIFDFFRGGTYYETKENPLTGLYYKPLMLTTFSLISSIFGLNPFAFHLLQISLHITNSILTFYLFRYFFGKKISLFLSLIFLIHPINSESVFYISALQESLFYFFGISSLLLLIYKKGIYISLIAPFFLLLSLLSKESGILFLIAISAFILFYHKNKIQKFFPFTVSMIIYLLLRFSAIGLYLDHSKASPIAYLSLQERLINIPSLINFYLKRFLYPKDLVFSYNEVIKNINFTDFYFPLITSLMFVFIILLIGIIVRRRNANQRIHYLFFSGLFIAGVILHLQIIPLDMSASERWFYFPMLGALGVIGILSSLVNLELSRVRKIIPIIAVFLIMLFSVRTIIRGYDWKDNFTLATHDVNIGKNDYLIHGNLGFELAQRDDLYGAEKELKKSIDIYPYAINNYSNYCSILAKIGKNKQSKSYIDKSIGCFQKMTEMFESEEVYRRLIYVLLISNKLDQAQIYANEALKKYPQNKFSKLYLDQIKLLTK